MSRLVISNASVDAPIVDAFVELLEGGMGFSHEKVFCTSSTGQGSRPGDDFAETIRLALADAPAALAMISENYYASVFSVCELGGMWVQAKKFIPILVPPLGYGALKAVLAGKQAVKLDAPEALDGLYDVLRGLFTLPEVNMPRWSTRRGRFLKVLPELIKTVPSPTIVSPMEFEKIKKERDEYKKSYEELDEENDSLKAQIEELRKLKDRADVAKLQRKYSNDDDIFEGLAGEAKDAMRLLHRSVLEALYYRERGEPFCPEGRAWDDVRRPVEEGYLSEDDDGIIRPNNKKGEVKRAMAALDALSEWLEGAPGPFRASYARDYDEEPNIGLRSFWRRHLVRLSNF